MVPGVVGSKISVISCLPNRNSLVNKDADELAAVDLALKGAAVAVAVVAEVSQKSTWHVTWVRQEWSSERNGEV